MPSFRTRLGPDEAWVLLLLATDRRFWQIGELDGGRRRRSTRIAISNLVSIGTAEVDFVRGYRVTDEGVRLAATATVVGS